MPAIWANAGTFWVICSIICCSSWYCGSTEVQLSFPVWVAANDIDDVTVLAEFGREIAILSRNVAGSLRDVGGYGLADFRADVTQMIARENPPYKPVGTWYLFNLIRLPGGGWGFATSQNDGGGGGY